MMNHPQVNLKNERTLWAKNIEHVAGVDEAGRGPLAGPVVAAAVIFPKEFFIYGVDDSKKIVGKKTGRVVYTDLTASNEYWSGNYRSHSD